MRLAKNGFVEIKNSKQNSRLHEVYLTKLGEEKAKEAWKEMESMRQKLYVGLSQKQIEDFKVVIQKINQNLQLQLKEEENETVF